MGKSRVSSRGFVVGGSFVGRDARGRAEMAAAGLSGLRGVWRAVPFRGEWAVVRVVESPAKVSSPSP